MNSNNVVKLKKNMPFECYLIGQDSMIDRCAEIILEEGGRILGICSSNQSLRAQCEKDHIRQTDSVSKLESWMKENPGDFLFSVVNTKILKNSIVSAPRRFSINFHNAPLPAYAGVHATAWAILNREKYHGVTWHVLEEGIDTGPILKQAIFEIEKNETNFSLNMKCTDKGIGLFRDLLKELKSGSYKLEAQDFSKRSYYTLYQKPKNFGIVSWETFGAEKICVLQRGMNFADYANTFCLPKFVLNDRNDNNSVVPIYFGQVKSVLRTKGTIPGEIIDISDRYLRIATKTRDVILSKISDGNKEKSDMEDQIADLVLTYGLKVGDVLPSISNKTANEIKKCAENVAKHEAFWIKSFEQIDKLNLFSKQSANRQRKNKAMNRKTVFELGKIGVEKIGDIDSGRMPSHISDTKINRETVFATIILLYLYRLNNYDNYSIGYYTKYFQQLSQEIAPFFADVVPLNVDLSPEITFEDALKYFDELFKKVDLKQTFSNDIALRYSDIPSKNTFSIRLSFSDNIKTEDFCFCIGENEITLSYPNNLDDIDKTIVENMRSQIENFAKNLFKNSKSPIKSIQLLTEAEEYTIKKIFNDTTTNYPRDCSIPELFEQQVKAHPNKVALKHGDHVLTYNELNCKANQIARYLISLGVQKGNIITVYFNKGVNSVVGMLAVLKAGAAYTPIDPSYPKEYVNYTLKDTNAYIILTQEKDREMLEKCLPSGKFIIFSVDSVLAENKVFQKNSKKNLDIPMQATDLVYIMYTSGSTGKPKGVMIHHRGVVRLVKNTNYINIESEDCLSQVSSISFDASTFEIWGALLNGAQLVFADNNIITNTESFAHFLLDEKVSILTIVSAVLDRYASADPRMFRNLKYIYVGGDILNVETVDKIIKCSEGSPKYIINGYGPTENTNCTTAYSIPKNFNKDRAIPIGKAVANTTVYVVDKYFNNMPIGVFGELCTGGDGLALGYLNKPELTDKKFVNIEIGYDGGNDNVIDSHSKMERIYKTGDSVRWLHDGNIDFACRLDNQVKVRGFRIELEAIELQLLNCGRIEQCSVVVKEKSNRKSLVAYIKPKNVKAVAIPAIRQFLKNKLPPYMIPNTFVIVDSFPKLPNGKIDKKSLVENAQSSILDSLEAPRNDTEIALVDLWKELLDLDALGINENFFDLGGYSLLMTEMMVKVKEIFNKTFSLPTFLESPTIKKLASLLLSSADDNDNHTEIKENEVERLFYEDVFLPPIVIPAMQHISGYKKSILLTGATGFVGVHLLNDFYKKTDSVIYCLIRAIGIDDARQRLISTLKKHGLDAFMAADDNRVHLVLGDLSRPEIGMDHPVYEELSGIIDEVHHCGAHVHHIYTYEMLHKVNVLSTKEIIKFAAHKKLKKIHYVSAISSAIKFDDSGRISEKFLEKGDFELSGLSGYAQTKLASEVLLTKANKCGIPVFIYRPAWIIGDNSVETNSLQDNHLLLLLKGCVQMKAAPRLKASLNLMPVGMVSSFIVYVSENRSEPSSVFNLIDTSYSPTWNDLIKRVKKQGYEIRVVSPKEWSRDYISKIDSNNFAYSLKPLYADGGISWANAQNEILNCCCENYIATCGDINFNCANENEDILDNCKIIL